MIDYNGTPKLRLLLNEKIGNLKRKLNQFFLPLVLYHDEASMVRLFLEAKNWPL